MRQIPGPKQPEGVQQVMRVVMEEKELHRLLDPILKEVNVLRKRVAELEETQAKHAKLLYWVDQTADDGK